MIGSLQLPFSLVLINTISRDFSYPSTKSNPKGRLGPDAFFIAGTRGTKPDEFLKRGNLRNSTGIIIPLPFPETGLLFSLDTIYCQKYHTT